MQDDREQPQPQPEAEPASFLSLLDIHDRIEEIFLVHQEALLDLDIPLAAASLRRFGEALRHHIQVEEDILLPIYQQAPPPPGGATELFRGEHRKLCEFLDRFEQLLALMQDRPADLKRRILHLYDLQASFKNLMEHHDLREKNIFYPTLDAITSRREREALLPVCAARSEPE